MFRWTEVNTLTHVLLTWDLLLGNAANFEKDKDNITMIAQINFEKCVYRLNFRLDSFSRVHAKKM